MRKRRAFRQFAQRPREFEPGSKWSYCNPGIDTLGRLAEAVSGTRFEDLLREKVLSPLGMKDTTFYPSAESLKRLASKQPAVPAPMMM